jgi:hypothetical protein
MRDIIGSADMTRGKLTSFIANRFGNLNSALALNGGWTQVPPGIYFNTPEFTISVWVFPSNVGSWSRIIDFGNGSPNINIIFSFSYGNSSNPLIQIFSGLSFPEKILAVSPFKLTQHQWQFVAVTFNGTNTKLFLNGQQTVDTYKSYNLPTLTRFMCYIGKSNWSTDGNSHSYLDDLRFYNKSLSQEEILELMNQNETGEKLIHSF